MKSEDTQIIPNPRQMHIGWWLQQAARQFNGLALAKLRERGHQHLTATHLNLLPYLEVEGTRINTLAKRAVMTKQAASQTVTELEKYGYVTRHPDPSDGRAMLIIFTEQGEKFLADAQTIKQELWQAYQLKLGENKLQQLEETLRLLLNGEHSERPTRPK